MTNEQQAYMNKLNRFIRTLNFVIGEVHDFDCDTFEASCANEDLLTPFEVLTIQDFASEFPTLLSDLEHFRYRLRERWEE